MKKYIKSTLFTLALVSTLTATRPAQATISLLTLNGPLALAGLAVFVPSLYVAAEIEESNTVKSYTKPLYFTSIVGFFVGAIILDENQSMSFSELTEKDAVKLNLSEQEVASFNAELDQANLLLEEAQAELSELSNPTLEDSQRIWSSLKETVAPETFSAMQKITSQINK
jgi:hypothetical protein